ncbi:hypothetical protein KUTeg_002786 [Tegillarca granosa]|uniref:Cystatin domain-containing protein n=1 Tax=Tegillarca granosa TaxID=220873 RepID=A0ABQ9FU41_TEGGR|nr:hypothetical protein KUTeg_007661 [Tegillarca granosa]KAJ8319661.1 hypothetical protein KUTeg_002786 [Tegillarca granosa]
MAEQTLAGGLSEQKPADKDTQDLVDKVKDGFLSKSGENVSMFKLVSYKTQVVAGTSYFAKVQIGDGVNSYVHLRIWQQLPSAGGGVQLSAYQTGKSLADDITYFE